MKPHLRKQRRTDRINRRARCHRIKPCSTEDVPRRHLTAIFVADQSIGSRLVKLVHDLPHPHLCLPGGTGVVVEISDVMAWLIALCVLSDEAGDVGLLASGGAAVGGE